MEQKPKIAPKQGFLAGKLGFRKKSRAVNAFEGRVASGPF
jgi:hypothetical protein